MKNPQARESGFSLSLFKRLSEAHPDSVVNLEHQYRMNADIMSLSNEFVYSQRLRCGSDQVANLKLDLPHLNTVLNSIHSNIAAPCDGRGCWIRHVLSPE